MLVTCTTPLGIAFNPGRILPKYRTTRFAGGLTIVKTKLLFFGILKFTDYKSCMFHISPFRNFQDLNLLLHIKFNGTLTYIVECPVWRGGTKQVMELVRPNRRKPGSPPSLQAMFSHRPQDCLAEKKNRRLQLFVLFLAFSSSGGGGRCGDGGCSRLNSLRSSDLSLSSLCAACILTTALEIGRPSKNTVQVFQHSILVLNLTALETFLSNFMQTCLVLKILL